MQPPNIALTQQQTDAIAEEIITAYNRFNLAQTNLTKYNIIYGIIDMKLQIHNRRIYKDLKICVKHYVDSVEEQDFGYDIVAIEVIQLFANELPLKERKEILKYFSRRLDDKGYDEEKEQVNKLVKETDLKIMAEKPLSIINPLYYISLLSQQNTSRIIFTIAVLFLMEYIFLMRPLSHSFSVVEFSPHHYTNNYYFDTFISIPGMILDINDDVKVKPINWLGALDIILAKLFFIIFVAKFLFKKIEDKTKFD